MHNLRVVELFNMTSSPVSTEALQDVAEKYNAMSSQLSESLSPSVTDSAFTSQLSDPISVTELKSGTLSTLAFALARQFGESNAPIPDPRKYETEKSC